MSFKLKITGAAASVLAAALAAPLAMAQWPLPSIGDQPESELINLYKRMEASGQEAPVSEAHVVSSPRPSFNDNPEHYRDVAGVVPPVAGCPSDKHVVSALRPSFNDNPEHYRQAGTGAAEC